MWFDEFWICQMIISFPLHYCRYVILIPSAEGFVAVSILLRISGGVGTAFYMTAAFAIAPKLFPKRVTVIMV